MDFAPNFTMTVENRGYYFISGGKEVLLGTLQRLFTGPKSVRNQRLPLRPADVFSYAQDILSHYQASGLIDQTWDVLLVGSKSLDDGWTFPFAFYETKTIAYHFGVSQTVECSVLMEGEYLFLKEPDGQHLREYIQVNGESRIPYIMGEGASLLPWQYSEIWPSSMLRYLSLPVNCCGDEFYSVLERRVRKPEDAPYIFNNT